MEVIEERVGAKNGDRKGIEKAAKRPVEISLTDGNLARNELPVVEVRRADLGPTGDKEAVVPNKRIFEGKGIEK